MSNEKIIKKPADLPDDEIAEPKNDPTTRELLAMLIQMRQTDHEHERKQLDLQREQLKQTRKKSNDVGPDRSVFNPRGQKDYPMPDLKCEVLMPWPLRKGFMHGLTREEVELMNLIEPGEYVISLLDGTDVQCCVLGTRNTLTRKVERLAFMGTRDEESGHYSTLYSKERRNAFPSMVATLREILDQKGTSYAHIMTMKEENRRIALPPFLADGKTPNPDHLSVSQGE